MTGVHIIWPEMDAVVILARVQMNSSSAEETEDNARCVLDNASKLTPKQDMFKELMTGVFGLFMMLLNAILITLETSISTNQLMFHYAAQTVLNEFYNYEKRRRELNYDYCLNDIKISSNFILIS